MSVPLPDRSANASSVDATSLEQLFALLVDPVTREELKISSGQTVTLRSPTGSYEVTNGIPRFVVPSTADQQQTADAFGFKWHQTDTYNSPAVRSAASAWFLKRYGFKSATQMRHYLEERERVVDLGCGSGFSTSLWLDDWNADLYVGVDISSAIDLAAERLGRVPHTAFVQADVLHLPIRPGAFGASIAEGVLHHTLSTKSAIESASRVVASGGEVLFYVYRTKAPTREWTDDYIRDQLAPLSDPEAWEALRPLTRLGQALSELHVDVVVPEEVALLGIPAGRIDVQRLLYWNFVKLFWNEDYSFDENLHINFDWYRPRYAHRQSEEQVREWCEGAGLRIFHLDRDPSGFTVRATRI